MNDERPSNRGPELGTWLVIAALILVGLILYFRFAPYSPPVAPPPHQESE